MAAQEQEQQVKSPDDEKVAPVPPNQPPTKAAKKETDNEAPQEQVQLVVFGLDNEEYCCPLTDLKEIIQLVEITPVPNTPEFVKGIINLRGKVVVVVDLEEKFGLERSTEKNQKHIVIIEDRDELFGLIVDEVTEVIRVPASSVKDNKSLQGMKIEDQFIKGVVLLQSSSSEDVDSKVEKDQQTSDAPGPTASRMLVMLDVKRLIAAENIQSVQEAVQPKD